jgi:hypothetical protein
MLFRLLSAIALAISSAAAFAWGEEGHRLIGYIADQHLTPGAAREVAYLLRNDRFASGERSNRTTLAEVAYWADEIRDYNWGKAKGRWHYDDIPMCGEPDPAKYCRKGNCASEQLARHMEMLKDRRIQARYRNEALKWVVHIIGDLHQPLHAADHDDNGGNRIEVSFFGERDNPPWGSIKLHTIWDVHILRRLLAERGGEAAFRAQWISGSDKHYWERGTPAQWIQESHRMARDVVYRQLPGGLACARERRTGVVALDERYYERAAPLVDTQIRKAGIRLARVLNDLFERPPAPY